MTFRLVTVAQAKDQLSILASDTSEDSRVEKLAIDASAIVMRHIKKSPYLDGWTDSSGIPLNDTAGDPATDSFGNLLIPPEIQRATLIVIAKLDDDREGKDDPITPAAASILGYWRDPALA